jgi:hypothetical protein
MRSSSAGGTHSPPAIAPVAWPTVLVISAAAAYAVTQVEVQAPIRFVVVLWFLAVCPGMGIVGLLRTGSAAQEWTFAVAVSIALEVIVAGTLLYLGSWLPELYLAILIGITGVAAALQMLQARASINGVKMTVFVMLTLTAAFVPFVSLRAPLLKDAAASLPVPDMVMCSLLVASLIQGGIRQASKREPSSSLLSDFVTLLLLAAYGTTVFLRLANLHR